MHQRFSERVQPVRSIIDPRFGPSELYRDPKTESYVIRKEANYDSQQEAIQGVKDIEKRMQNPNLYYVPIADYTFDNIKTFCAIQFKTSVFVPYPEEDLYKEISERIDQNIPFSNQEMTTLLYDIVGGHNHIQKLGFHHGEFDPNWVALTTTGYAVVENPLKPKTEVKNLKNMTSVYLSPEAYRAAKNGRPHGSTFNRTKSDVFSVGLVLLEAGLLREMPEIYNHRKSEDVDYAALENNLRELESRYPDNNLLYTTVRRMLDLDQDDRPDFQEIKAKLPEYKLVKKYFKENPDSKPNQRPSGASQPYSGYQRPQEEPLTESYENIAPVNPKKEEIQVIDRPRNIAPKNRENRENVDTRYRDIEAPKTPQRGWKQIDPDTIESPTGVYMKRAIQKHPECPVEWEPYHDQEFGEIQRSPTRPYEFIPTQRQVDPSRPSLKRISIRHPQINEIVNVNGSDYDSNESRRLIVQNPNENLRVEYPMRKVISDNKNGQPEPQERDIVYSSPERRPQPNTYTRYISPQATMKTSGTESCPLEDPRNPYHQEYLKLKEKADGDLDIKSGVFSPRKLAKASQMYKIDQRQPIYINEGTSNHATNPYSYSPDHRTTKVSYVSPERKNESIRKERKSGSDTTPTRIIRQREPLVERRRDNGPIKYSRPPIYTKSQILPDQKKSHFSTKSDPKEDKDKDTTLNRNRKQVDQYHYCDDCDIAFKDEEAHQKVHKIKEMIAQRQREGQET